MKKSGTFSEFIFKVSLWLMTALILGRVVMCFSILSLNDILFIISLVFIGIGGLSNFERDLSIGSLREVECINYSNEVIRKKEIYVDNSDNENEDLLVFSGYTDENGKITIKDMPTNKYYLL